MSVAGDIKTSWCGRHIGKDHCAVGWLYALVDADVKRGIRIVGHCGVCGTRGVVGVVLWRPLTHLGGILQWKHALLATNLLHVWWAQRCHDGSCLPGRFWGRHCQLPSDRLLCEGLLSWRGCRLFSGGYNKSRLFGRRGCGRKSWAWGRD